MHKKKEKLALLLSLSLLIGANAYQSRIYANENAGENTSTTEDFSTAEQREQLEDLQALELELAQRQSQLDSDMQVVRGEIQNLNAQSADLNAQLEELLAEGVILEEEYDKLIRELDAAKLAMEEAIMRYEQARTDVDLKQEEYEARLVAMYKRSEQSTLDVLLSSDGLTGFFTNLELLSVIGRSDQEILEDLTIAREAAEHTKVLAEEAKVKYETFVAAKEEEINQLANGVRMTEDDIADIQMSLLNRSGVLSGLEGDYSNTVNQMQNVDSERNQIYADITHQAQTTLAARAEATRQAEATRAATATRAAEASRAAAATRAAEVERARIASLTQAASATRQAEMERARWAEATRAASDERNRLAREATRAAEFNRTRNAQLTSEAAAERSRLAEQERLSQLTKSAEATRNAESRPPASGFYHPTPGVYTISNYYGWRTDPLTLSGSEFHNGIDLAGPVGSPIVSMMAGTVVTVSYPFPNSTYGGWHYGNYIVIQHDNGLRTLYSHLKNISVVNGQRVGAGQYIGSMGSTGRSTGPHLHFEVQVPSGGGYTTVNPYSYLFG